VLIPLKASVPVKSVAYYPIIWLLLMTVATFLPRTQDNWLLFKVFDQRSLFFLIVNFFYIWSLSHRYFEKRSFFFIVIFKGVALGLLAFLGFEWPLFLLFSSIFMGAVMRHDIWSSTDSFLFFLFKSGVFQVPSYVLLFFWLFYLLLAQIFGGEQSFYNVHGYLITLLGFLWGFLLESLVIFLQGKGVFSSSK